MSIKKRFQELWTGGIMAIFVNPDKTGGVMVKHDGGIESVKGNPLTIIPNPQPTTTPQLLLAANPNRISALIINNGTNDCFVGNDAGITTAGAVIFAKSAITDNDTLAAWYGVTASGTADIRIIETSKGGA